MSHISFQVLWNLLKRNVNVFDPVEAKRFIEKLQKTPQRKKDLENLYRLSDNVHSHKICAPDKKSLESMIRDLDEKGYIYNKEESEMKQNQKIRHHNLF